MIEIKANPRSALVVAHPSHELRLHGWLQRARPLVSVLTDGSGQSGRPRLPSTTRVLDDVGAQAGRVYGRITDLEVYAALLNGDSDLFIGLAEEIAEELISEQIEYVVGDAAEGYSSAHDVCRFMLNAAVALANRRTDRPIANLDFNVLGHPVECPDEHRDAAVWLHLDDQAFSRKVAAAHSYNPKLAADIEAALKGELFQGVKRFSEPEIAGEVDAGLSKMVTTAVQKYPRLGLKVRRILGGVELDAFRIECLRPVVPLPSSEHLTDEPLFYEFYGEQLVAAGRYDRVIRQREHMLPIVESLARYVEGAH